MKPYKAPNELHNRLVNHCKQQLHLFKESEDLRGFHPHITIAFRDLKKPLFYELEPKFAAKNLKLSLNFTGFSLLKLEKTGKCCVIFKNKDQKLEFD